MNKKYAGILGYLALVLCAAILIAGYYTAVKDISWIAAVESSINKENWKPNSEYIPIMGTAFFLCENGTEQFFFLHNNDEFISYTKSLIDKLDRQVEHSISKQSLDEILASDRVLMRVNRFPVSFGLHGSYLAAFFILEDNLGKSLEGTIIIEDRLSEGLHYTVWEITKWSLW